MDDDEWRERKRAVLDLLIVLSPWLLAALAAMFGSLWEQYWGKKGKRP